MSRSSNSVFSGSEYSELFLVIDVLNLRERNVGMKIPQKQVGNYCCL